MGSSLCHSIWNWLMNCHTKIYHNEWFIMLMAMFVAILMVYYIRMTFELITQLFGNEKCIESDQIYHAGMECYRCGSSNGPHAWPSADNNQSPVNIDSCCAEEICLSSPLIWVGYEELPLGIRLENNGHTLLLRAAFNLESDSSKGSVCAIGSGYSSGTPHIDGADLMGCFKFHEITFRWSWYNGMGSEHILDDEHFPLEMQCLHTDGIFSNDQNRSSSRGLIMVSYMFNVSDDNPLLDVIIQHLVAVQVAGKCVEIPPFPLSYLMLPFGTDFYSYHGSLTEPPYHRGVEWFICPVPLSIGERQLHEFRKLRSRCGSRIGRNSRPVQGLVGRTVKFNRYRSSR